MSTVRFPGRTRYSTATPSAKAHERVTGRWVKDSEARTRRDRVVYFLKVICGTPIPWLLWSLIILSFVSRAGSELAAWSCAALTLAYLAVDRIGTSKELSFFRVGADFFLLGYVLVTLISALMADSLVSGVQTLGGARWVFLLYLLAYCWELFPGLNRAFGLMMAAGLGAAFYGVWQHFTGLDLLRGTELFPAPAPGTIYFVPTSFFGSPEVFGTLVAMALPFPAAAYLLNDRRDRRFDRWIAFALTAFLGIAVFWTYRPGLWITGSAALVTTLLLTWQGRSPLAFLTSWIVLIAAVIFVAYDSPEKMFDTVQNAEIARAERQREQINTQVKLWQESTWTGVGTKAREATNYDPGNGNVYFQILAESGVLGASFYLLFLLAFLLSTYRVFHEVPPSHYWHRVLIGGALGAQIAFHVSGLYWSTLAEAMAVNLFVLILASVSYLTEHYHRGLVPDDSSL